MATDADDPNNDHELGDATAGILFRALLQQTKDQVYFKDRQSRFVRASDEMATKFGLKSVEELYGKTDFDLFSSEHAQQAYDDEQRLMRENEEMINFTEKETWPDGHITWVTSTKIPLRLASGKIAGIMGITRDITEQVEAQRELERNRELLQKKNEVMEADLRNARTVQRLAIPGPLPRVPFAEVSVSSASLTVVSGDVVTFPVRTRRELSFINGDISGHGVTAGLFTMLVKHLADHYMEDMGPHPEKILKLLDKHLEGLIPDGFLAAMAACFERRDDGTVRMTVANSAQPPVFLRRHNRAEVEILYVPSDSAIGLGISRGFEPLTIRLEPGDCLLFVSDGATECRDPDGNELGEEGMARLYRDCADQPIDALTDALRSRLERYCGNTFPQDDTTLVALRITNTQP